VEAGADTIEHPLPPKRGGPVVEAKKAWRHDPTLIPDQIIFEEWGGGYFEIDTVAADLIFKR